MDFDPRDSDSRDEHRFALTRDHNDNGPTLGRSGGNSRELVTTTADARTHARRLVTATNGRATTTRATSSRVS